MASNTSLQPILGYTTPSMRRVPVVALFLSRRTSGSIPNSAASKSTTCSVAKATCVEPGARYAKLRGLLTTTS